MLQELHQTETPVARTRGGRADTYWVVAVSAVLILLVAGVFGQTARHQLVEFDDAGYVRDPHITPGLTLAGLRWAFTDGPFGEWYPLTALSHMLDWQLFGEHLAGHFLTSVLLHAVSSVLLFLVLRRMTGALWPSAWVAAVFAVHPLRVESVAWLAERRDMLSGLFFMLTLWAYARYAERPSVSRYLAVGALFTLGLLSKPVVVTLPFVLLLLDYWPLGRFRSAGARPQTGSRFWLGRLPVGWRLLAEKLPFLLEAVVSCKIVLSTHLTMQPGNPLNQLALGTRLANALAAYAAYLGQSFFPVDLAFGYPYLGDRLPINSLLAAVIVLAAISGVALWYWRRFPFLIVGWLWFVGMLVPLIGLVRAGSCARCDHYTYLSQIGLSIAVAWTVWTAYQRRQALRPAWWRSAALAAASGAVVLLLAGVAWRQTSYWSGPESLWRRTVDCTEENMQAHYNLAVLDSRRGNDDEAIALLRKALTFELREPWTRGNVYCLLATELVQRGEIDEALALLQESVRAFPDRAQCHTYLAMALDRVGRPDQALAEWREAVRLSPDTGNLRLVYAAALVKQGDKAEAANQCREILAQEPGNVEALAVLGELLAEQGQTAEAIEAASAPDTPAPEPPAPKSPAPR